MPGPAQPSLSQAPGPGVAGVSAAGVGAGGPALGVMRPSVTTLGVIAAGPAAPLGAGQVARPAGLPPSSLGPGRAGGLTARQAKIQDEDDVTRVGEVAEGDALLGAVDINAESELLLNSRGGGVRTLRDAMPRYQEEYVLNVRELRSLLSRLALRHQVTEVDPGCLPYLALAVEAHMGRLLASMAKVACQRGDPARSLPGIQTSTSSSASRARQQRVLGVAGAALEQPAGRQTLMSFARHKPIFQQARNAAPSGILARTLGPLALLPAASPSGSEPVATPDAAPPSPAEQPHQIELGVCDLTAALERDTLLARHPVLWRMHGRVAKRLSDPSQPFAVVRQRTA